MYCKMPPLFRAQSQLYHLSLQSVSYICWINWCAFYTNKAKIKGGYLCTVYSSTHGELSTSCWGSCDKWQSCRFNSGRVSNTCHNSFSPQLSKCWLLHGGIRCAIKANLSLYSCVNPAMFNQMRSLRALGRRDESRRASIRTQSEGRPFHRSG